MWIGAASRAVASVLLLALILPPSVARAQIVVQSGLSNPTAIAVDGTNVYYAEQGTGTIKRVPVTGGSPVTLASGLSNPGTLTIDGANVYFAADNGSTTLYSVPKAGGSPTPLATGQISIFRLTLSGSSLYWTYQSSGGGGAIKTVPVTGGAVTTIQNGGADLACGIAVDGVNAYWTSCGGSPATVHKVAVGGGGYALLASGSNAPGIATDGANVYFASYVSLSTQEIDRVPVNGGSVTQLATGLNAPWDVAIDSTDLFWIEDRVGGSLGQVAKQGGPSAILATGLQEPVAIALDSTNVYWLERNGGAPGSGSLKKIAKGPSQTTTTTPSTSTTTSTTAPVATTTTTTSTTSTTTTLKAGSCGDGAINSGEQCDKTNLNGKQCSDLRFFGGTLSCTASCQFDTSRCTPFAVFLPGFGGSELTDTSTGQAIWTGFYSAVDKTLTPLGISRSDAFVQAARDVPGTVVGGPYLIYTSDKGDIYGDFLNTRLLGRSFAFPYDWRDNLYYVAQRLDAFIRGLALPKVDLVTHSTGGLLAKEYLRQFGDSRVRKLVMVAAPNYGTYRALWGLEGGDNFGFPWYFPYLTNEQARQLAASFPSVHQLLPSASLNDQVPALVVGTGPLFPTSTSLVFSDLIDALVDSHNTLDRILGVSASSFPSFYEASLNLPAYIVDHPAWDCWSSPNVDTVVLAGCDKVTAQAATYTTTIVAGNLLSASWGWRNQLNGDGTVPLFSALASALEQRCPGARPYRRYVYRMGTDDEHFRLFSVSAVEDQVKHILDGDDAAVPGIELASDCKLGRKFSEVNAHSPVALHAYDSRGRHTGPSGDLVEQGIPGSAYNNFGTESSLVLPEGDTYRILANATADGLVSLDLKQLSDGQDKPLAFYNDLTVSLGAALSFDWTSTASSLSPPALAIDSDGDGTTDAMRMPTLLWSVRMKKAPFVASPNTPGTISFSIATRNRLTGSVHVIWIDGSTKWKFSSNGKSIVAAQLVGDNEVHVTGAGRLAGIAPGTPRIREDAVQFAIVVRTTAAYDTVSASITRPSGLQIVVGGDTAPGAALIRLDH